VRPDFDWDKQDALARGFLTEQDRPFLLSMSRKTGPEREPVDNLEKPSSAQRLGLLIKSHQGKFREGTSLLGGSDIMASQHQIDFRSRASHWPRVRNMPLCSLCSNSMVAPEASALQADGDVSYLWSCDSCGHGFVTHAALYPPAQKRIHGRSPNPSLR
jgi:hypothetical protein